MKKDDLVFMSNYYPSIPPIRSYRNFLKLILHFVLCYLEKTRSNNSFDAETAGIVNEYSVKFYLDWIQKRGDKNKIVLGPDDVCMFYACFHIVNKLLISSMGEEILNAAIATIPDKKVRKDFNDDRDFIIERNNYLISDTQIKMPDLDGLAEMKEKLSSLIYS